MPMVCQYRDAPSTKHGDHTKHFFGDLLFIIFFVETADRLITWARLLDTLAARARTTIAILNRDIVQDLLNQSAV